MMYFSSWYDCRKALLLSVSKINGPFLHAQSAIGLDILSVQITGASAWFGVGCVLVLDA